MKSKTCTRCSETKEENQFYGDSREPDGMFPECIDCEKDQEEKRNAQYKTTEELYKKVRHRKNNKVECLQCRLYKDIAKFRTATYYANGLNPRCIKCQDGR